MEILPKLLILLKLMAGAYVLFVLVMSFLAIRTAPKNLFGMLVFLASVTPFIVVWSAFRAFLPHRNNIPAYDESRASIEDKIEAKRVAIFGGSTMDPSLSMFWKKIHHRSLQIALQKTANTAKRIVSFGKIAPDHS